MAVTLLKNQMTLAEAAKRLDAQGNIAEIIEILNEENPFLTDAHIEEANDGTTHLYTKRKSLPTVGHRRVNEGAIKSQSDTEQLREQTTLFEVWTEIDEEILSQQGAQKDRFLNTEAVAKIEALAQNGAEQVVYGNPANDPQDITGFIPRYNSLALPNVYGIGGTGSDLASLLLVEWDPK